MKTLDSASRLWQAVKHFAGIDMSIEALPDTQMGDLFEHIMYKSFDTKGKAAGAFYTPRDAIRLMVDILFASDDVGLTEDGASRAVYDPLGGYNTVFSPADGVSLGGEDLVDKALQHLPHQIRGCLGQQIIQIGCRVDRMRCSGHRYVPFGEMW